MMSTNCDGCVAPSIPLPELLRNCYRSSLLLYERGLQTTYLYLQLSKTQAFICKTLEMHSRINIGMIPLMYFAFFLWLGALLCLLLTRECPSMSSETEELSENYWPIAALYLPSGIRCAYSLSPTPLTHYIFSVVPTFICCITERARSSGRL
ncbi:hypothetical protein TNIN_6371 [Trichonephila inaurata madagascariensis]|uniref:Uncharacterized protein n=1 Tax=Trichonephila inaurata madagascariensis TaxID=2747483 RepID=A0A8X6XZU8_9ARAC|nr:hypothetical protein TNIN_6371 [Trichonephila inaurata madagascariensis]